MNIDESTPTRFNDLQSYSDYKESEIFLNLDLLRKIVNLFVAGEMSDNRIVKDQITKDIREFEIQRILNIFVKELNKTLNDIENPELKIKHLVNLHTQLQIEKITNENSNNLDLFDSIVFIKEKLKIVNDILENLRPIPEVSISKDALSINKNNIIPVNIEEIDQLANSLPAKIVLLYELGIYDILKQRIKENNLPRTDLAKLISYVINEKSANYVYSYLSNTDLDPFNNNYHDEAKDNPFTHTAIKAMTRILLDCNLKVEKGYPTKIKPNRKERDKK